MAGFWVRPRQPGILRLHVAWFFLGGTLHQNTLGVMMNWTSGSDVENNWIEWTEFLWHHGIHPQAVFRSAFLACDRKLAKTGLSVVKKEGRYCFTHRLPKRLESGLTDLTWRSSPLLRRQWHPTSVFLPGESQGRGAVYGVAQSWTRLKWLSSCRNLKEFTAFLWEDVRVWAYWNRSFDMYLNCLGPISCVFISWVSSGLTIGSDYSLMTGRWQAFFSFLCTPRIHSQGSGCNHRWLWHPFTDMAVNILFIKANCLPYLLSPKPLPWHSLLSLIENGI